MKIIFFLFVTCCFVPGTLGSQANTPSAKVAGTVFVRDSAGNEAFVSGATVRLDRPATLEAQTDANGKYVVAGVPFGTYTVEVALPGLKALRTVQVEGNEVRLPLELKPMEVTTSVVVTPDAAEAKDSAPSETISKNPSFWTKSTHFVQVYQRSGPLWFPFSTQSVTEARFFGTTDVSIEYFDYVPKASRPPGNSVMSAKEMPKP